MVKALRFLPFAVAVCCAANALAKDWADYQMGDTVEQDIITPVSLRLVDAEATQALKQKEAQQVPPVVRLNTNAAAEVDRAFQQAFARTRNSFLSEVEKAFGKRVLNETELASPKFSQLAAAFQSRNRQFPLYSNRAALWATGDQDQAYRDSISAVLRKQMAQPIRPDSLTIESSASPMVSLVPVAGGEKATVENIESLGASVSRNAIRGLTTARRELEAVFHSDERLVGRYAASLIKPNCTVDHDATAALREKRTEALRVSVEFQPGQVIARSGDVVNGNIKAAIDQLKEKVVLGQLQQLVAQEQSKAASEQAKIAQERKQTRWLVGGLTAVTLLLAAIVWQLARRKPETSLAPVRVANENFISGPHAHQMRAGLMAHLAAWLSHRATQKLLAQRGELLETQQTAAAEIAELEARLEKIHAPLKDRLSAYERRITELEKELTLKGEENRELIKAKIEIIQQQLEIERGKNRLEFN